MTQLPTHAIDSDELWLAQLACAKLVRILEGALSIGLPALSTGVPEPRAFLEERFRILSAFATVLHSISGKPGGTQEGLSIRVESKKLLSAMEDLRSHLLNCADNEKVAQGTLESARLSVTALFDAMDEYARLIALDNSCISSAKAVIQQVFDSLQNEALPMTCH